MVLERTEEGSCSLLRKFCQEMKGVVTVNERVRFGIISAESECVHKVGIQVFSFPFPFYVISPS